MKWLYFIIACLACLLALDGCGSFRPSSINKKDDQANSRDSLETAKQKFNLDSEKKSFDLENGGYQQDDAVGWKSGLIINRFAKRQIRFVITTTSNRLVAEYTINGGQAPIIKQLPIGRYRYIYWENTNKGWKTRDDWQFPLEITNKANRSYNGQDYYFVLTN